MADEPPGEGGFEARDIDEVVHGPVRLAVVAYLSGAGRASFGELKKRVGVTDGNLSVHLRKLEEAGYVRIEKAFVERRPLTTVTLTDPGRAAWIAYLDRMRGMLFGS